MTEQEFADKMIKELQEAGYDYDGMLRVIKLAKDKFKHLNRKSKIVNRKSKSV